MCGNVVDVASYRWSGGGGGRGENIIIVFMRSPNVTDGVSEGYGERDILSCRSAGRVIVMSATAVGRVWRHCESSTNDVWRHWSSVSFHIQRACALTRLSDKCTNDNPRFDIEHFRLGARAVVLYALLVILRRLRLPRLLRSPASSSRFCVHSKRQRCNFFFSTFNVSSGTSVRNVGTINFRFFS